MSQNQSAARTQQTIKARLKSLATRPALIGLVAAGTIAGSTGMVAGSAGMASASVTVHCAAIAHHHGC